MLRVWLITRQAWLKHLFTKSKYNIYLSFKLHLIVIMISTTVVIVLCSFCLAPFLAQSETLFVYPDVFNETSRDKFVIGSFPDYFQFGTATAAYQIEGAWNVDGKGPSIWDTYVHSSPSPVYNNETADDADKSYYLWDRDVQMMQELGAKFYRYSFSWPRILPKGVYKSDDDVNWAGVQFYNETVNKLIAGGIEPVVTLFHWDLPQALQDQNGYLNADFPTWFAGYAQLCFRLFGDRVQNWITFNEPQTVADCFEYGNCAPGIYMPGVGGYQIIHQWLLAHQKAWHIYDDNYRSAQQGLVGMTICGGWCDPNSQGQADIDAAQRSMQFGMGWLMSPLIGTGNYPQVMIDYVGNTSKAQGFNQSRLPTFSAEEQKLLLGASDFFGLNYYSGAICQAGNWTPDPTPSMANDQYVIAYKPDDWPKSASNWLQSNPWGIRNMLNWAQRYYSNFNTPWYITENGWSSYPTPCEDTMDVNKTQYLVAHVNEVYKAVQDGANVQKYIFWSLMDNFEWRDGFSKKFGVYCVDFDDTDRKRTARYSANIYADIMKNRGFENQTMINELIQNGILTAV